MRVKRLLGAAAATVGAAGIAIGCIPTQEPWRAVDTGYEQGATGWTSTAPQNPSANSTIVSNRVADLVWRPHQPNSYLGTSLETDNAGIEVEVGDTVAVTYGMSSSTSTDPANEMPAGGAIRLFGYLDTEADVHRPAEPPTYQVAAPLGCAHNCQISFIVEEAGVLGYTGLVYDTSNGGVQGRVRFTDLTINGELVLFE